MGLEKPKLESGKKFASGTVISDATTGIISVSGLSFTPSLVILKMSYASDGYADYIIYASSKAVNSNYGINNAYKVGAAGSGAGAIVPNATGFTTTKLLDWIPAWKQYSWIAFE